MDYINVIIADLSQLSRLGLISLLNQMKYPFHIREIATPDKLAALPSKDQAGIFVISSAFLRKCQPSLVQSLQLRHDSMVRILISDTESEPAKNFRFSEIIDPSDHDKNIIRKLEKQLSLIYTQGDEPDSPEGISDREKEVLRLVAVGLTNKEIGDKLFISSHTVITHRKNISAKLGIKTIAGLTMYALINHLIVPEEKIR
jgi:DNA-binding CsgD family transcriptional regulator